ncbi:MAG: FAD:protein FMN transferase [Pseudomonadota bacterium]
MSIARWALLGVWLLTGHACTPEPERITIRGETMGSTFTVTVIDVPDGLSAQSIEAAIADVLSAVNATFSNWDADSEVSRFNRRTNTAPMAMSDAFNALLDVADSVHVTTDGAFDITVAPLIELWGFGQPGPTTTVPSESEILDALATVGQQRVLNRRERGTALAKVDPAARIYVAAIAKGAGVDAIATRLAALGLDNYLVEIGGDLRVVGDGPRGNGWRIGVEKPAAAFGIVQEALVLRDAAMATSGDYRNYFEADGQRFAHVIDPSTGRPITHRTASVSVIAEHAISADAWATALLVLGRHRGLSVAAQNGIAAMFLERDGSNGENRYARYATPAFENWGQPEPHGESR